MRTRYRDGRCIGPRFWLFLSAVAIGVYLALAAVQGSDAFLASVDVTPEDTPPTGGIYCYELRFADGTAVTVMGSRAVPLIQFLAAHKRLAIEARPREIQRIER